MMQTLPQLLASMYAEGDGEVAGFSCLVGDLG